MSVNQQKIIKEYFPNNKNFLDNLTTKTKVAVNPRSNKYDPELIKYIEQTTSNLKLNILFQSKSNIPSTYTIPILADSSLLSQDFNFSKFILYIPILSELYKIIVPYRKIILSNLDAYLEDNKVIIFTGKELDKLNLNVFIPVEFNNILLTNNVSVRSRFSIILHELGHWHDIQSDILISLIRILELTIFLVKLIFMTSIAMFILTVSITFYCSILIVNLIKSNNESNADNFAKKLGYGNDLSLALRAFGKNYNIRLPNNNTLKQLQNDFSYKLKDFQHRISIGYPSIGTRISNLTEAEDLSNLIPDQEKSKLSFELYDIIISFSKQLDSLIKFG